MDRQYGATIVAIIPTIFLGMRAAHFRQIRDA
jgi:hypothetical protein